MCWVTYTCTTCVHRGKASTTPLAGCALCVCGDCAGRPKPLVGGAVQGGVCRCRQWHLRWGCTGHCIAHGSSAAAPPPSPSVNRKSCMAMHALALLVRPWQRSIEIGGTLGLACAPRHGYVSRNTMDECAVGQKSLRGGCCLGSGLGRWYPLWRGS